MVRAAFKAVELLLKWLVGSTPTSSANYLYKILFLMHYFNNKFQAPLLAPHSVAASRILVLPSTFPRRHGPLTKQHGPLTKQNERLPQLQNVP